MNTDLKKLTRTIIIDESIKIIGNRENLTGFSLPADSFLFEDEFNRSQEMIFSGVEQNKEIYSEGLRKFDKRGAYENSTVNEFFKSNYQRFNLIWLDYCSNFNMKMIGDLRLVLNEENFDLSESNAIFGITIAGNRDPQIEIVTKFMGLENTFENRAKARIAGVPLLLMHYVEQWNSGIELVPIRHIKYHDELNGKRTPMYLHLFRVKKSFGNYNKYELGVASSLVNKKIAVNA